MARGGFDGADYAKRIERIFATGRIVGRGQATEQAADRLARGVPWQHAGTPAPSAGNGSAMRAAPVGLMAAGDPRLLLSVAHDQGRITHADPRCSAGAVVVAGTVAIASSGSLPPIRTLLSQLSKWATPFDRTTAEALKQPPAVLRLEEPVRVGEPDSLARFSPPLGPGIRVDSGVTEGSDVPPDFDSNSRRSPAVGSFVTTIHRPRARLARPARA